MLILEKSDYMFFFKKKTLKIEPYGSNAEEVSI